MTDKVQKIREVVEKRYEYWKEKEFNSHTIESEIRMSECQHLLLMLDSLQEDPVSDELEEAASRYAKEEYNHKSSATLPDRCIGCYAPLMYAFKDGANWKKEQIMAKSEKVEISCASFATLSSGNYWAGDKLLIIKEEQL